MPVVTVRMDAGLKAGLKELAWRSRTSMEEVIRQQIRDAVANDDAAFRKMEEATGREIDE